MTSKTPRELEPVNAGQLKRTLTQKDGDYYMVSTVQYTPLARMIAEHLIQIGAEEPLKSDPEIQEKVAFLKLPGNFETKVFPCDENGGVGAFDANGEPTSDNWLVDLMEDPNPAEEFDQEKYMTQEEALVGHELVVSRWQDQEALH